MLDFISVLNFLYYSQAQISAIGRKWKLIKIISTAAEEGHKNDYNFLLGVVNQEETCGNLSCMENDV